MKFKEKKFYAKPKDWHTGLLNHLNVSEWKYCNLITPWMTTASIHVCSGIVLQGSRLSAKRLRKSIQLSFSYNIFFSTYDASHDTFL